MTSAMRPPATWIALLTLFTAGPLAAQEERERVFASEPTHYAVTVYRDPERVPGERMERDWPQGYAMISETRTVTLPPGRSTILFEGVAEGMVAVSAIVTGLPGGTIEKNRNADLLSPAALVDRTLGNRVTITRTNPATGEGRSEEAIVRTRADGGLVLQTRDGFEAVRCSGLPEKLTFPSVPRELSSRPIFNIDTHDETGGTYEVTLTYLSWGFDWEANYVAQLGEGRGDGTFEMGLMSWLTVLNDNGQSFPDAQLMVVAGEIAIESDFEELAEAPLARGLSLTCYPFGSTARGSPTYGYGVPPAPPPPPTMSDGFNGDAIVVTGARRRVSELAEVAPAMTVSEGAMASEEQLADLKLYRVPREVTVSAKGLKQIAFLARDAVRTRWLYRAECDATQRWYKVEDEIDLDEASIKLFTQNKEEFGLGASLPMGTLNAFEATSLGPQLVAQVELRDYPVGQEVELDLGESARVYASCGYAGNQEPDARGRRWTRINAVLWNANDTPAKVRLVLGYPDYWEVRSWGPDPYVKNGELVIDVEIPANGRLDKTFRMRRSELFFSRR
ncbi:DUF4139 domain-containing protein [Qipengyuania vesicularis]|uniref:DUF4139 domain-containing protein n=1 Tax=Qipengyuania vesicularis TaxID=2867232 RepID=UPI001C87ACB3|nr:hypothetical protein [Qipengyuania vesicularis]MBX7526658.1 hypothetical protein [Qipengyuania vesicularis]